MPWDGILKRSSDNGKESPEVILARVDENIKFLKSGAESVRIQLNEHEKKDDNKFINIDDKLGVINRTIWMVSGGAGVLVFLIDLLFRH